MIIRLVPAVILLAFCLPAQAQSDGPIAEDLGTRVAESFARPAVEAFAEEATSLAGASDTLCREADAAALDAARAALGRTVAAFGPVSMLRFGPLAADNRFERLFFWPDPRGVTLRQVQGLIAEEDASAVEPGGLAAKSVALQGLPALDFVLHGAGAEALIESAGTFRCRYAAAIAANVDAVAGELVAGWAPGSPFAGSLEQPGVGDPLYRSKEEVAAEIVKALGTGLQYVRNAELMPALGETSAAGNGRRAPLWRSGATFALVDAQVAGLDALLRATGFEDGLPATSRSAASNLHFEFARIREALDEVDAPPEAAFADGPDRERLRFAALSLDFARRTVSEQLAGAIGLVMGFNALDGD